MFIVRKLFFLIIGVVWLTSAAISPVVAFAADTIPFTPQVSIPGTSFVANQTVNIGPTTLAEYIKALYTFGVQAGAIVAVIVIMFGGINWVMAGGSPSQVTSAKSYIAGALGGLTLLLLSWVLLQTINPALTQLKSLNPEAVAFKGLPSGTIQTCCSCHKASGLYDCHPQTYNDASQGGTCYCTGAGGASQSVANEADCKAIDQSCIYQETGLASSAEATNACRSGRGLGPEWTCDIDSRSCDSINECLTMAQQKQSGPCTLDSACDIANGYSCNHTYDCSNSRFGVIWNFTGGVAPTGCCMRKGAPTDLCVTNSDCQSNNCSRFNSTGASSVGQRGQCQ